MPSSSQSGTAPPIVEGDRIVSMHLFDDTTANNNVLLSVTLCFDKVLNSDRIHSALVRLLNIGEWRKLGGRLRRHVSSESIEIGSKGNMLTLFFRIMAGSRFTYLNLSPIHDLQFATTMKTSILILAIIPWLPNFRGPGLSQRLLIIYGTPSVL